MEQDDGNLLDFGLTSGHQPCANPLLTHHCGKKLPL